MGDRLQHARHVVRMAAVLAVGLVAFLIARSALIPPDFGVLGYYRAGALDDIKALPIVYAGRTACMECHDGTYDPPEPEAESPGRTLAVKCDSILQRQQTLHAELRSLPRTAPETRG